MNARRPAAPVLHGRAYLDRLAEQKRDQRAAARQRAAYRDRKLAAGRAPLGDLTEPNDRPGVGHLAGPDHTPRSRTVRDRTR